MLHRVEADGLLTEREVSGHRLSGQAAVAPDPTLLKLWQAGTVSASLIGHKRAMYALFNLFLDICLFRKGPQDVPASAALLKICLLAYGFSGLVVLMLSTPAPVALLQILLDLVLLSGLLHLALIVRRHPQRFGQTLSALTGTGALMALLALPLMSWIVHPSSQGAAELPSALLLALMVWSIAIMAHILRQTFATSIWIGALYAIGYTSLSWTLTGWIGADGG